MQEPMSGSEIYDAYGEIIPFRKAALWWDRLDHDERVQVMYAAQDPAPLNSENPRKCRAVWRIVPATSREPFEWTVIGFRTVF